MHFHIDHNAAAADISRKLRELPNVCAPPLSWDEFKRRQRRGRARHSGRRQAAQLVGIAILLLGTLTIWSRFALPPLNSGQRATLPARPAPLAALARDQAARRSAVSERWLAALPEEPVVVHVGTRVAVTNLEDRIAWVDDTLSWMRAAGGERAGANALQDERNRLINSLAQVRYAEALASDAP